MKRSFFLTLTCVIFLTACSAIQQVPSQVDSPLAVFQKFDAACKSADIATAESLVTASGIADSSKYGVCVMQPDGTGMQAAIGGRGSWKLDPPEIVISGNTAYVRFHMPGTDTSNIVVLYKTDGTWKINTVRFYATD